MNKIKFLLVIVLLVIVENSLFAQNEKWEIIQEVLEDTTGKLTIEDVTSEKLDSRFDPMEISNKTTKSYPYSYWVRFKFVSVPENLVLLNANSNYKKVELYLPDSSGKFKKQEAGFNIPFKDRPIQYKDLSFIVPVQKEKYYYLKIELSKIPSNVFVGFSAVDSFINYSLKDYLYYGFFFGIVFLAALYSFILYLRMRENAYLYYTFYVLSMGAFMCVMWDLTGQFFSFKNLLFTYEFYTVPYALMTIWLLFYARNFLDTKNTLPTFDKILVGLVIARIVIFILGATISISFHNPNIDNIFLFVAYLAGIIRLKNGYTPSKYFILAFTVLYSGLLVHATTYLRISLSPSVISFFSIYNTGLCEIVFFSFALADRFKTLKLEKDISAEKTIQYLKENSELKDKMILQLNENELLKDRMNKELEHKVLERTTELQIANDQLIKQALEIERMNSLLQEDNKKLEHNVKDLSKARVMQKRVTFDEFKEIYPDEESCYKFLDEIKWSGGFECKKCGNKKFSIGNTPYSRRCSKCNYIERITSHTIFSRMKFPITKAFYMLFLLSNGKNITADELSQTLTLRRQTCWVFKKKILQVIENTPKMKRNKDGWSHLILLESTDEVVE